MKRLAISLVSVALVLGGIWIYHVQTRTVPYFNVDLVDEKGSGSGLGLPEVDGYVNGNSGSDGYSTTSATYKVVANTAGKFFVLTHYRIERAGVSTEFDGALPVFAQKPDRSQWAKLDPHYEACAYLSGGRINY